jgi:hypothetical protein
MRMCRMRVSRALRHFRGSSRPLLGWALAQFIGPRANSAELSAENISSVLICRINGRLGNTVFLTPLIRSVHAMLPHASIDVATAYPQAAELFDNFPGVRRVIQFPHKGAGLIGKYLAALYRMRAQRYDLVIDPVPESTGGRVAMTLCRARYRVGFAKGSQWAPLTHAVAEPDIHLHQAIQPVFLLCRIMGQSQEACEPTLSLCLRQEEIEAGGSAISRAIGRRIGDQTSPRATSARAFGFFAHATGLKIIERAWWLEFWQAFLELQPDAIPVEFLPTPLSNPLDVRFASMHCPSPRGLTAAISATRLFISADTGPMHLASSTAVPTVAVFRASDPAVYGPLKPTDLAIDFTASTPQLVAQHCQRLWRESAWAQ